MAYMPLDDELETKGMSTVEVIGGRFGNGWRCHQLHTVNDTTWSLLDLTPILAVICAGIVAVWIGSVLSLGKEYTQAMAQQATSLITA